MVYLVGSGHTLPSGTSEPSMQRGSGLNMATDTRFEISPDLSALEDLDSFALLACQQYNFRNVTHWFGEFRGGLFGFRARIYGLQTHYRLVHSWVAAARLPTETEYHVASIFFNMDSAIECFTYMLNAIGDTALPGQFHNVTDKASLKRVGPHNILAAPSDRRSQPGYAAVFPNLQAHWQSARDLILTIMEQHDVSKHRQTIYRGGMSRKDPPDGFYERLGAQDDPAMKALISPHAEINLGRDPKEARARRVPRTYEERIVLEAVVRGFCAFISRSCVLARDDAQQNIKLKYDELQVAG